MYFKTHAWHTVYLLGLGNERPTEKGLSVCTDNANLDGISTVEFSGHAMAAGGDDERKNTKYF